MRSLTAKADPESSVLLEWNLRYTDEWEITDIQLEYFSEDDRSVSTLVLNPSDKSYTLLGLSPGTLYSFVASITSVPKNGAMKTSCHSTQRFNNTRTYSISKLNVFS